MNLLDYGKKRHSDQNTRPGKMTPVQMLLRFICIPLVAAAFLGFCFFICIINTDGLRNRSKYRNAEKRTVEAVLDSVEKTSKKDPDDRYRDYYRATWQYEIDGRTYNIMTESPNRPSGKTKVLTMYQEDDGSWKIMPDISTASTVADILKSVVVCVLFLAMGSFVVIILWMISAPSRIPK